MTLTEQQMDLFTVPKNCYLVECISSDFALGAGIAKEFRKRGCADELAKRYHKNSWDGCGYAVQTSINGFAGAYHLVTKQKYFYKPSYKTMIESLRMLRYYVNYLTFNNERVTLAMPRIGCGLDRLQWDKVKEFIEKIFGDIENLDIIVCYQ